MGRMIRESLDSPEETRPFEDGMGQLQLVNLEAGPVGRATFQPGWQWSKHVKPSPRPIVAKLPTRPTSPVAWKVVMDDGEEMELGPGDFSIIPPGHDAWIVGDEPCVVIDWQGFADYAKRK
jgi:hypothetical protein